MLDSTTKRCYPKSILQELKLPYHIRSYIESFATLNMILNPVQKQQAQHFNVQCHWVRECHKTRQLHYYHSSG